ncbi:hypothetical protein LCGC14_0489580 [marine sediment metagenome]|uniref:Uncharacterized protein n=1 Tax=marine sediment metagenome TaxID=412755 RepID=A0A0F9VFN9_9ZZZZ
MPRPKRTPKDKDAASEALLDNLTKKGQVKEERDEANDDPFLDQDGDMRVVPTNADLSGLVSDEASINSLPFKEILRRNLQVTLRATEMAELAYHANPRQGTATALTSMQNLATDLIKAIEERQDPMDLASEVEEAVIQPMIAEFIKILTSEAERKRSALMAITPAENAGVVSHEMRDLLAGIRGGMDEAYDDGRRKLEDLLCSKIKKTK